jgi:hypothetical protein
MAKFGKKPTDDQMLEGGGAGAGMGRYKASPKKSYNPDREAEKIIGVGFGAPLAAAGTMAAIGKADREATKEADKEREAKKGSMTTGEKEALQEVQDEKMRQKMKTAPTTKTEMGKPFAGGGMTASSRADGCAQRGKTRGTIIR